MQMLRIPNQLTSDDVLAQPSVLFSVGLLKTEFQYQIFYFQVYGNMGEGNIRAITATENF